MRDLFNTVPYGGPPAQRHSRTSQKAAASIKYRIGDLHRAILQWLESNPQGACDERMAGELDMGLNTFRPRRRELQLMGYVEDSGRTEMTKSGRGAVVWTTSARIPRW